MKAGSRTEVLVEEACILGEDINRPVENTPCLSMQRVTVSSGMDVGTGLVDGRVDEEAGGVDGELGTVWGDVT